MTKKSSRAMHYAHIFAHKGMDKSHALTWGWHVLAIHTALKNGILRFRFTKANGEIREAKGTLHPLLIPADKMPKGTGITLPKYSSIAFFDLDKQDWRAFSTTAFDEVLEAYQITEVLL